MDSDIPVQTVTFTIAPDTLLEGRFRIVSLIGSGGMASVYLADHLALQEKVAVKILDRSPGGSSKDLQRFKHEAKALQKIAHRNVVRVHSFGLTDGNPYMVMEYVEGEPLDKVIKKNGRLELNRVLAIFKEVCAGLQAAHDEQIVHRDLKPSNILLANDCVKLVDFGIAKPTSDANVQQQFTATGALTGTPLYMSPERCKSLPEDCRSDIYSVGCVLFECLTGQPPFAGESPLSVLSQQLNNEVKVPSQFRATARIWTVIRKCMEKEPEDRYASAAELAADLTKIETAEDPDPFIENVAQRRNTQKTIFCVAAGLLTFSVVCVGAKIFTSSPTPVSLHFQKRVATPKRYYHQFSFKIAVPPRPNDVCDEYYNRVLVVLKGDPTDDQVLRDVGYANRSEHAFLNFALANYCAHRAARACAAGNYTLADVLFNDTLQALDYCPQNEARDLALADVLTRRANMYFYLDKPEAAIPLIVRALDCLQVKYEGTRAKSPYTPQRQFNLAITQACLAANLYKRAAMASDDLKKEVLKKEARDTVKDAESLLEEVSRTLPVSQKQLRECESMFESLFPPEVRESKHDDASKTSTIRRKQNEHYKSLRSALRSFRSEAHD